MIQLGLAAAAAALGFLVYAVGQLSLIVIIQMYIGLMLASLLAQMLILSRKGLSFRECYLVLPLTAIPLLVSLL
jgi:hypothetical protein